MIATDIARVTHGANRVLQRIHLEQGTDEGVPVAPKWEKLDDMTKRSIVEGVQGIINGATPAESHQGWIDFKVADGWSYGPVKDSDAKTHPCLVPYEELPPSQKVKDTLFHNIVKALAE